MSESEGVRESAARSWKEIAFLRAQRAEALATRLSAEPDVAYAPAPGSVWSGRGITCPCDGLEFVVRQWACKNGVLERTLLTCTSCAETRCWDALQGRWAYNGSARL